MRMFILIVLLFSFSNLYAVDAKDRALWLKSELNLSKSQKKEIKKILDEYQDHLQELRNKADASKEELKKAYRSDEKGRKYTLQLLDKFEHSKELKAHFQRTKFMMALEIRKVLNDKQIKKLNNLKGL